MIYGYTGISTGAQDHDHHAQLRSAGREEVCREIFAGRTSDRPQLAVLMKKLTPRDVVITPAVDRRSRDTTDLLVIARDMQRTGGGIRLLADSVLDTASDFAEIIFAILGVAANLERRCILECIAGPMPNPRASNSGASRSSSRTRQKEVRARLDAGETQHGVARS